MKKLLILLTAFALSTSIYAGAGCGGGCSSKKGDKVEEKTDDKASGASCGEKKDSEDTCTGKDAGESNA